MAEWHVRTGERHVANQREIVWRFAERGQTSGLALETLKQFEDALELQRQHLERLLSSG